MIYFYSSAKGRIGHVGIVYKVSGNKVYTIEGNTSGASSLVTNGGGVKKNAQGIEKTERRYDDQKRVVWYRYVDAEGQPMAVNGVFGMEQGYDENGNLNREVVLDGEGNKALHPDGWCEHTTVYNDAKQKVSERWLGIEGEPVLLKDSHSGIDRAYDEAGNVVRETYYDATGNVGANAQGIVTVERRYDDQKRVTRYRYLDAESQSMSVNGVVEMEQGYDENGNLDREVVLDGEGNRTLHPDGWCEHTTVYNEAKQKVSEHWLGIEGEPVLLKGSHSGIDRAFDEAGNVVRETYYDSAGNVGANAQGIVTVERRYDDQKRVIRYRYLDLEGQPMAVNGVVGMEQGYDENGNLNREVVLDGEGNRALHPDGWCAHTTVYNEAKQKVSERWLGIEGEPVLVKGSHSGIDRAYDEAGNVVRETYYDATGNVGANAQGIVTVERRYDDQKRVIRYRYLDVEGQPMAVNGVVGMEQSYWYFMWSNFFDHIDILKGDVNILDGMAADPEAECAAYEAKIASLGGIGVDGHLAFNEPFTSLTSRTGVRVLTSDTRIVNSRFFGNDPEKVPAKALSVGIGTVMDAREVLILINGHNKARALAASVEGGVSQKWTCSTLQTHPNAIIACDEPACGELTVDTYKYFLDIEKAERL